jgi:putative transposase
MHVLATSVVVECCHGHCRTIAVAQLCYNYHAHPDAAQRQALARGFGCARVVWNDCLRTRTEAHRAGLPHVPSAELSTTHPTQVKRTPERPRLAEVSAVILWQSPRDLDAAYRNFFDGLTGKRPRTGPPRFTSKKDGRRSVRLTTRSPCGMTAPSTWTRSAP